MLYVPYMLRDGLQTFFVFIQQVFLSMPAPLRSLVMYSFGAVLLLSIILVLGRGHS